MDVDGADLVQESKEEFLKSFFKTFKAGRN
jgi:hypothetical protein